MSEKSLRGANYSLKEYQLLWENSEYFICIYKINAGYDIVIEKANETYLNLFNIKERDYEKAVEMILPIKTIQNLTNSVEIFIIKQDEQIVTKREFEEVYGRSYWNVTHQLSDNKIFCIGRKVYDLSILPKKNPLDLSYPSLLVSLTKENRYKIESFSDEFKKSDVHSWMYSGYLDECPSAEFHIKTTTVVDECIRLNQTIQYIDLVTIPECQYFVLVTLVPIIHTDQTKVLIIVKPSNNSFPVNSKNKLDRFSNELVRFFNSKLLGICFLEITSTKSFEIALSNDCFDSIIKKEEQLEEAILKSSIFKQCILTRNAVRGYIKTKESREMSAKYFVQFVPTITDNKVSSIMLTIDPQYQVSKQGKELLLKLTKREREILSYVADGYTNKYISSKLNISEGTVKRIISNGYKKLEICSRVELAKIYLSED